MLIKYDWKRRWHELEPVNKGKATKSGSLMNVILMEETGKDVLLEMYRKGCLTRLALKDAEELAHAKS